MTALDSRRVALVEDHALFAEALETALVLAGYDAQRVCLTEDLTVAQLTAALKRLGPATALLDLDLGSFGTGMPLIEPLTQSGVKVIVVTASGDLARWGEAVWLGARKVLAKNAPLNDVIATIRRTTDGLPLMRDEERLGLIRVWRQQTAVERDLRTRLDRLTRREGEVLGLLMTGRQVGEIAATCFVSESTVRTQVKSILAKLQVGSQIAAVGLAHRVGWQPTVIHQRW